MLMVAVATSFYCAFQWGFLRFNYPDQTVYPVQGLDVSHHQGEIDWQAINAQADQPKYRFVFIKATEGGDFKDPRFVRNWKMRKMQVSKSAPIIFIAIANQDWNKRRTLSTVCQSKQTVYRL